MNKVLIVIIVVISAYLAYGSFNDKEDNPIILSEKNIVEQVSDEQQQDPEEVYENDSHTIDGNYILNITTNTTETIQEFSFSSNGTFELTRQMISPNPELTGSVEGTYTIIGNTIELAFPTERDKKTFPVDTAKMTIRSETELVYSGSIARLD